MKKIEVKFSKIANIALFAYIVDHECHKFDKMRFFWCRIFKELGNEN